MSDTAARAAMERMNLREVAVSPVHTSLAADLQSLALANPDLELQKLNARRADLCEAYGYTAPTQSKPFAFADGVAIIPFHGSLINRFGSSYGFITGYNFIERQMRAALDDEDVTMIVGDFNSNGGEAAGCFERSDMIYEMRGQKPMLAVVDSNCYSAAYALASAFDKIAVTPSGGAGSIGVVAMHMDVSAAMDRMGVKITFIHFGDQKVEGNPYEKLSPDAKKRIQASVDQRGEKFVELVARNRNIDAAKVKGTQAAVYLAEEALELGLIDTIASPSEAVQVFSDGLSGSTLKLEKEDAMSNAETKPGATDQANTEALAKASTDARTAERARVGGIINCEEAKGRESLANHLAMNTEMSLDAAKGVLAAAPVQAPAAAAPVPAPAADTTSFKTVMDASEHPNVGAAAGTGVDAAAAAGAALTPAQKADAIMADAMKAGVAFNPVK